MRFVPRHFRLPLLAFLASMGVVLAGSSNAQACEAEAPVQAPRACCAAMPPGQCRCCEMGDPAPAAIGRDGQGAILATPGATGLAAPDGRCECRSNEPGSPASRHESRDTERTDEARSVATTPSAYLARPASSPARVIPLSAEPPRSPLYLRVQRLLI